MNGVRTIGEIIGRAQQPGSVTSPQRWWLALDAGRPVGVLLLAEMPDVQGWDLSYLGVVPEARRQGFGRQPDR